MKTKFQIIIKKERREGSKGIGPLSERSDAPYCGLNTVGFLYFLPKKHEIAVSPLRSLLIFVKCLSKICVFTISEQYFSFFLINVSKSGCSFCKSAMSRLYFWIADILFLYFHISSNARPKNWQIGFINWLLT